MTPLGGAFGDLLVDLRCGFEAGAPTAADGRGVTVL